MSCPQRHMFFSLMAQQRRGRASVHLWSASVQPGCCPSILDPSRICSWHWKQAAMPKQEEIDKCAAVAFVPVTGTRLNSEQGSDAIRRRSSPNLVLPSTPSHFTENKFNTTPHGRLAASGDGWVQPSAGIFLPQCQLCSPEQHFGTCVVVHRHVQLGNGISAINGINAPRGACNPVTKFLMCKTH